MIGDVVVDASVWVSRLISGDVQHTRCQVWFRAQASEGGLLVAPVSVLPEVAGAIARRSEVKRVEWNCMECLIVAVCGRNRQDLPCAATPSGTGP